MGCCAPEDEVWPNILARRLGAKPSNLAHGSATSESVISQPRTWPSGRTQSMLQEALSLIGEAEEVAAVTLGIGAMDYLGLRDPATGESCLITVSLSCQMLLQFTADAVPENLNVILAKLKAAMSPETPLLVMTYYFGDCTGGLNGMIRAAIRDHEAIRVNVCEHFQGEIGSLLHWDGLHKNSAGHSLIADVFTNAVPPDADGDGLSDLMEDALGSDPALPDSDVDGCLDGAEFGPQERSGGRRDPATFWDFFDTPNSAGDRDRVIDIGDIFRVVARFGTFADPPPTKEDAFVQALSVPPASGYHTAFDRSPPGPGGDPWDLGPPDGTVGIGDIFASVGQFGHSCA